MRSLLGLLQLRTYALLAQAGAEGISQSWVTHG
jgi:hypothetical protein